MSAWDLEKVELAFGEAALAPSKWSRALEVVATQTESFGAILLPVSGQAVPGVPYTESLTRVVEEYFRNGWHLNDERTKGVPVMMRKGVVDDLEIVSEGNIRQNPYYQEFLGRAGLRWFGGVRIASGNDVWCLSIQRSISQGPFSKYDKQRLERLASTLATSAAVAKAVGFAEANAALDAFEVTGAAVLLFDAGGHVTMMNPSAEKLLMTGDPKIKQGRLVSKDRAAADLFGKALNNLLWRNSTSSSLSHPIPFSRSGLPPVLAYAMRLPSLASNTFFDCRAAAVLVDLSVRNRPPEHHLVTAFKLTGAEARLAAKLATGTSLEAAAGELGVAKETARNQLKSVFSKTGARRQSELAALFARFFKFSSEEYR